MTKLILLLSLFVSATTFSQITDTLKNQPGKTSELVTFKAKVDIANATKDGIYLKGYVVNIDYEQAKKLHGKKIKITGKVTIVTGLKNLPDGEIRQGREEDTKYIESPKIKIIKN